MLQKLYLAFVAVCTASLAPPPLYRTPPSVSLYAAGVAHGRMAKARIAAYLRLPELVALSNFTFGTAVSSHRASCRVFFIGWSCIIIV